jgi:competence protein ComEC
MTRPPGVVLVAAGYGAGLIAGLSHLRDPVFVGMVLLLLAAVLGGEWWRPALVAAAIGVLAGRQAQMRNQQSCAARLPMGDREYVVHAIDPAEGSGRVALERLTCRGRVVARWPRQTSLPAGIVAQVEARWMPRDSGPGVASGTLMIGDVEPLALQATATMRVRTAMVRRIRNLFGARAALVDALVGGWRGEIDPDIRDDFARAGMMHLLAISGFHIAWLAGWVLLLLRTARVGRHPAEFAAAGVGLAYAAFLGWPAAATRAAILLAIMAICRWRQRSVRPAATIGCSAIALLLIDPSTVINPGAWLSMAGIVGVVHAIRWSARAINRRALIAAVAASTGAFVATAPWSAFAFGQVAPAALLANLVAAPLLLLTLPAVAVPVLVWPVAPGVARAMAASGNLLLTLLVSVVHVVAQLAGTDASQPGWQSALPWSALLAVVAWATWRRTTVREAMRRLAWAGTVTAWLLLLRTGDVRTPVDSGQLAFWFLDVGQGDGALIRTPRGHWIEVDAGPVGEGRDAGRAVVAPALARLGASRIDLFVLSHAHRDHVGGAVSAMVRVPVALAVEPGEQFADSAYEGWLSALALRHVRWHPARAGESWTIDSVRFTVLHPPTAWPHEGEDLNEDSLVLELEYGEFRALLMGDAGFVAESQLAGSWPSVNLLKVGHHGSRTATSAAFLDAVHPQVGIVSVGRNNYGHPAPETLTRLTAAGVSVWRTDQQGTVSVITDGRRFTVKGVRSVATFDVSH